MGRHYVPTSERVDVPMHADLREILMRKAEQNGYGLSEQVVRDLCAYNNHPLERGLRPHKPTGRKPKPRGRPKK